LLQGAFVGREPLALDAKLNFDLCGAAFGVVTALAMIGKFRLDIGKGRSGVILCLTAFRMQPAQGLNVIRTPTGQLLVLLQELLADMGLDLMAG
jgi:hypothetical protein